LRAENTPRRRSKSYPLAYSQPAAPHPSKIATNWLNSPCIGLLPFPQADFSPVKNSPLFHFTVEHTFVLPKHTLCYLTPFLFSCCPSIRLFTFRCAPPHFPPGAPRIFTSRFRATVTGFLVPRHRHQIAITSGTVSERNRTTKMSDGEVDMKIDTARAKALSSQLQAASERIGKLAAGRKVCHLIRSPPCEHAITGRQ
jgi:hypothetical protein